MSLGAILLLLFAVLISLVSVLDLLYFYISTFRSMCAVPNMAVFCSSLTSWFLDMLLTYFLNDFEIVPVAPIITGITFVFTFHMRYFSIVRSLSFLITFLSPQIATSVNIHVPFSLSRIIMSDLLLGIVMSDSICWFHNIIIIIIIIHEVVLFNTLRRQYTASKQRCSAADNERLRVFSLTFIETLLPSTLRPQLIHNEVKRISKHDLRKFTKC